jgi:hypothetical protein
LRNEKQSYPGSLGKSSNARGIERCQLVEQKAISRRQGWIFDHSTKGLLLYERSLRAKLRPSNESILAGTNDDVLVLLEFYRTLHGLRLRKYPYTLQPLHPKQVSSTETNRYGSASCSSRRSSNAILAISVQDGRA